MKHPVDALISRLHALAEGCYALSANPAPKNSDVYAIGDAINGIVAEYRKDVEVLQRADTKKDLKAVRIPGEDSYEVDV